MTIYAATELMCVITMCAITTCAITAWAMATYQHVEYGEDAPQDAVDGQPQLLVARYKAQRSERGSPLYRLYIGIADGVSIGRVWPCRRRCRYRADIEPQLLVARYKAQLSERGSPSISALYRHRRRRVHWAMDMPSAMPIIEPI